MAMATPTMTPTIHFQVRLTVRRTLGRFGDRLGVAGHKPLSKTDRDRYSTKGKGVGRSSMRKLSFRPALPLRGRKFKGLRGGAGKPSHPPLTDVPVGAYMLVVV